VRLLGIDAGHGGDQRGTAIPDGPDEADYVLGLAQRLDQHLRAEGHRPVLLRHYDQAISLPERGRLAAVNGCQQVLSLHVNAGAPTLRGLSCFVWPGDTAALDLARRIVARRPPELIGTCQSVVVIHPTDPEHWTQRARAVLRPYWPARDISAVLLEVGFARTDTDALLSLDLQQRLCTALVQALEMTP
jgi:N-acetylmuramoyl-L-alanine amidase